MCACACVHLQHPRRTHAFIGASLFPCTHMFFSFLPHFHFDAADANALLRPTCALKYCFVCLFPPTRTR